jgi:hypothetical protein
MLNGARAVGLQYDPSVLRLYPDPAGMQHDEMKSSTISHYSGAKIRDLKLDAPLHESVIRRFENGPVLHHDERKHYRPEALRHHEKVAHF